MPPVGFEPTISAGERPQTYALDRAATGTGKMWFRNQKCPYSNLTKEASVKKLGIRSHSIDFILI